MDFWTGGSNSWLLSNKNHWALYYFIKSGNDNADDNEAADESEPTTEALKYLPC